MDKLLVIIGIIVIFQWVSIPFKLDSIQKQLERIADSLEKGKDE